MANLSDSSNDQTGTHAEFLVVGLGASAGGVEALRTFFEHVPIDSGLAYVVILHLSPEHDSQLATVLQNVASIPVTPMTEQVRVAPNHVYVVRPNQHLTMVDGHIIVSPNTLIEERRTPIDLFFRTLADTHASRAVCVILSGTGTDGSMGLKHVKENGGAVFVQNPREAAFNEMPRNAIATDLVDDVLPVAAIPARIMAYQASLSTIVIAEDTEERSENQQLALREVFAHLRNHTGHDFSNYKRPTFLRRIERRMIVRNLSDVPAYAALLRETPEEVQSLLKDLLISVTNFFRDKDAFTVLEHEVLPRIFHNKGPEEQVRIWVAGCATGEEAYSIAMLCAERGLIGSDVPGVQIFATDIDEAAIAHARSGVYTASDTADLSPERLRRFFTVEDQRYRIDRELREMVLFAHHNVLKDPPFAHLDLVTCRNLLIYLNQTAQKQVMETFHFALNPGGYLFLGTSESVDSAPELYARVSREQHIFQSRVIGTRPLRVSEALPTIPIRQPLLGTLPVERNEAARPRVSSGELHQRLLEQYAPPSVVINPEYAIVHLSPRAGRYLQITGGELSSNLLNLIRPELRLELRTALYQAVQRQTNVDANNLPIQIDNHTELVTLHVRPVVNRDDAAHGYILVLFEPGTQPHTDAEPVTRFDAPFTQQLEEEVLQLKLQLRTSSEQYDSQTEQYKATNEELQAINEELRSSTEELETSKEEQQSINEELRTLNQELKVKAEEASRHSTNLQNLIDSTDIGTIFLDRSLRIHLFTPAACELFNLIPADYGRPLSDITHRLIGRDVLADAEIVLAKLQTVEREVQTVDNRVFMLRVLPYRVTEDRIGGVVMTFFDITERKRTEIALAEQARLLDLSNDAIVIRNVNNRIVYWNHGATELYGWSREEAIGQDMHQLLGTAFDIPLEQLITQLGQNDRLEGELVQVTRDGRRITVLCRWALDREPNGEPGAILTTYNDITMRKQAETALHESELRLRLLADAVPQVIWANDRDGKPTYFNQRWFAYSGLSNAESIEAGWQAIVHPDDAAVSGERWQRALASDEVFEVEYRLRRADGVYRWHLGRSVPVYTSDGQLSGWFGTATDIEELKQVEAVRRESAILRQLALAQEEERFRIARDLHDQLGQQITALQLELKQLEPAVESTLHPSILLPLQTLALQMAKETHRLAVDLRSTALEDIGLIAALRQMVANWSSQTDITAEFQGYGLNQGPLSRATEIVLYRVVQEALTNVYKHAVATRVDVIIERRNDAVVVIVEDNGRGFDPEAPLTSKESPRLGVLGMRERARQVDGSLEIESSPGQGTTVLVRIPLDGQDLSDDSPG